MIVIPRLDAGADVSTHFGQLPWSRAARVTGFLEVGGGSLAIHPTWAELAYDREALWVRFRCEGQRRARTALPNREEQTCRDAR